jgi:electron transfer flavoprotein beta subunit
MTNVLVCIKRVPDAAGEVLLTADEQSLDARFVGFTVSAHENSAVELAVRIAAADGGTATVLSLGPAETVEQLRGALGVGCGAAVLIEADPVGYGPADVAREIAAVVTAHEAEGRTYDLILLGNDAADTGDFQVGIRLAYELGRPVVNGVRTVEVGWNDSGGVATARGDGIDGVETYAVPLPAVVTVLEGGVEPRYPTITGRMKAKKTPIETVAPRQEPRGPERVRLTLPPAQPSTVDVLGEGPDAAAAVVDLLQRLGVSR